MALVTQEVFTISDRKIIGNLEYESLTLAVTRITGSHNEGRSLQISGENFTVTIESGTIINVLVPPNVLFMVNHVVLGERAFDLNSWLNITYAFRDPDPPRGTRPK